MVKFGLVVGKITIGTDVPEGRVVGSVVTISSKTDIHYIAIPHK